MIDSWNFEIQKGSSFATEILIKKDSVIVDLTGATAKVQGRETIDAATVIFEWNDGAEIVMGGVLGTVVIALTDTVTAAYDFRRVVVDLKITLSDGFVLPRLFGTCLLRKVVTRG